MKRFVIVFAVLAFAASALAQTPVKKTVKEFLRMSNKDSTYVELTGVVTRIRNYERGNVYIKDNTGDTFIYGVVPGNGRTFRDLDVREGDTLTVQGYRAVYEGTVEIKSARYVAHSVGPDHANVSKETKLDREPTFKGGDKKKFSKWVTAHLVYPKGEAVDDTEGKVVVEFKVGMDGTVVEPKILESAGPAFDAEVIRVMKKAPKWKPGMLGGKTVRVRYTMPIYFYDNH